MQLVSVVCVFHNAARFIEEALQSVESQSYADLEVILVDDGSTDNSARLAQAWAQRSRFRSHLVQHPGGRNLGISASRNLGLSLAGGQFIAFIDADDVWASDKIADQISIFREHPELDLVCGATLYWGSWNGGVDRVVFSGHVQNTVVSPIEASLNLYPLGRASSPCPSDFIVRRSVLAALGGSEPAFCGYLSLYEDQSMLAKVFLQAKVMFSDKVWLKYRLHPDSCSVKVIAAGRYSDVRAFYLRWFCQYLSERSCIDPRLLRKVRIAKLSLNYPLLGRMVQRSTSLLDRAAKFVCTTPRWRKHTR